MKTESSSLHLFQQWKLIAHYYKKEIPHTHSRFKADCFHVYSQEGWTQGRGSHKNMTSCHC